jgi:hypothetical protein
MCIRKFFFQQKAPAEIFLFSTQLRPTYICIFYPNISVLIFSLLNDTDSSAMCQWATWLLLNYFASIYIRHIYSMIRSHFLNVRSCVFNTVPGYLSLNNWSHILIHSPIIHSSNLWSCYSLEFSRSFATDDRSASGSLYAWLVILWIFFRQYSRVIFIIPLIYKNEDFFWNSNFRFVKVLLIPCLAISFHSGMFPLFNCLYTIFRF